MRDDVAVTVLRDAVKLLLESPDLNLESLEEDTIQAIAFARKVNNTTKPNCSIQKIIEDRNEEE